jgi:O-antigen ligase
MIQVTIIGYFLIPLGILLLFFGRRYLFDVFIFFIPFSASALVNVSAVTYGLTPAHYFSLLWMIGRVWDCRLKAHWRVPESVRPAMRLMFMFVAVASLSLIVPYLINGTFAAYGAQGQLRFGPVKLCIFNFTQLIYLVYGFILMMFLVWTFSTETIIIRAIKIYLFSALFVCLWGLQQIPEYHFNLQYPTLFNSSASEGAGGYVETIGNIKRISSVATEPSVFAKYLFSILPLALILAIHRTTIWNNYLLLCILTFLYFLMAILSIATTAYLGIGLIASGVLAYYFVKDLRLFRRTVFVLLALLAGILASMLFLNAVATDKVTGINNAIIKVTINKMTTGSGMERLEVVKNAFKVFLRYPLLGVGWGSVTSHDLILKILSNTGLIGLLCFLLFILTLSKHFISAYRINKKQEIEILMEGVGLSFIVLLITNIVTGFDFVFPHLWFIFGLMSALSNLTLKEG